MGQGGGGGGGGGGGSEPLEPWGSGSAAAPLLVYNNVT